MRRTRPTLVDVTDAELSTHLRANIVAYKQFQTARGALRHLGLPGLWAFAQPSHPETVSQQQVFFEDAGALEAALPRLEDFYRSHGVRLWRVLVPPGHSTVEQPLARAGYRPEGGGTTAMGMSLGDAELVPPGIALEELRTQEELIPVNVEAFGPGTSIHLQPWHSESFPHIHIRGVREHGQLLAGGLAHDVGDVAGLYLVATLTAARGRGLATEVMRGLLLDAHHRGRTVAVLQATELGYGVYRRVGMRDLGSWVNWVCRLSAARAG
ncbi:MAG: GNAT family N-acetyltransferase [Hyalangium sp.]|uniref:GNAT family N-acetyltransferase n=1 Tax=Hyalangium sp. TaxID=2028555 RepID=UPI00389A7F37